MSKLENSKVKPKDIESHKNGNSESKRSGKSPRAGITRQQLPNVG